MPRPIRFNTFSMNAASHQSPGLWRHPRNTSMAFNRLNYWTDLANVIELLVPELQRRGRYPLNYAEGSLRHKLFGQGDQLPEQHLGCQVRIQ